MGGGGVEPLFNLKAVVQRTGIPAATLRAWEKRFGVIAPVRKENGHRVYPLSEVNKLLRLKEWLDQGLTISQAVQMMGFAGEPEEPEEQAPVVPAAESVRPGTALPALEELRRRLLEDLLTFDQPRADQTVAEVLALLPVEEACQAVFTPVLAEVGELWQVGQASVAQEHFATAYLRGRLSALYQASPAWGGRGTVLCACPPGERHELGLLMIATGLRRHGWGVVYLGADQPLGDLTRTIAELRPGYVLLSAATEAAVKPLAEAVQAIARLAAQLGLPTRAAFGGRAFLTDPHLISQIPAVYLGDTVPEAVRALEQLAEH